jgi:hypothetical protein
VGTKNQSLQSVLSWIVLLHFNVDIPNLVFNEAVSMRCYGKQKAICTIVHNVGTFVTIEVQSLLVHHIREALMFKKAACGLERDTASNFERNLREGDELHVFFRPVGITWSVIWRRYLSAAAGTIFFWLNSTSFAGSIAHFSLRTYERSSA